MPIERKTRWLMIAAVAVVVIAVALVAAPPLITPFFRERVERALSQHLASTVELGSFRAWLFPFRVSGSDLQVHHHGRTDVPPLVKLRSFSVNGSLLGLIGATTRVRSVSLEGLEIFVPPDRDEPEEDTPDGPTPDFLIGTIVSDGATLTIGTEEPGKIPLRFDIMQLELQDVTDDGPFTYVANLTNPRPKGVIAVHGEFGPWQRGDPRGTALSGDFRFENADLGVFKGITGILTSVGRFEGELGKLAVSGDADVPDFALRTAGHPMRLETRYQATVDGTNGDTILDRIDARLGSSDFVTNGRVVKTDAEEGRLISLEVHMEDAELADMLTLSVKASAPPMSGRLALVSTIEIPPGDVDVVRKLRLDGRFSVESGRFGDPAVQEKVDELSQRGRGEPDTPASDRVFSTLTGTFTMGDGVMRFEDLGFEVPGAVVALAGDYSLTAARLDFAGSLRLDAPVSETVTGFKSILLKVVDPLFRDGDAGTDLPIRVTGTPDEPQFGVDVKDAITPG